MKLRRAAKTEKSIFMVSPGIDANLIENVDDVDEYKIMMMIGFCSQIADLRYFALLFYSLLNSDISNTRRMALLLPLEGTALVILNPSINCCNKKVHT